MALPVIAGIPWLAGVIGGIFTAVVGWFGQFVTKRLAIVAAAVTVLVGITSAFFATIYALASGLAAAAPPELSMAVGLVIPSNTPACISAYLGAVVARWAYDWNTKIVQLKLL